MKKISFKSVTFKNFFSYGNAETTIDLDRRTTVLIVGENGTGKTTILNAILYALFDKTLLGNSKSDIINNVNKNNLLVTLTFEVEGEGEYKIIRGRKVSKKGNVITIQHNGEDITPANVKNANKLIEHIIDVSYDVFVNIVVFSAIRRPFLDLPATTGSENQNGILEFLFGLDKLSDLADKVKEKHSATKRELLTLEGQVEFYNSNKQLVEEEINKLLKQSEEWEQKHVAELTEKQQLAEKWKTDIAVIQQVIERHEELSSMKRELLNQLENVNRELSNIKDQAVNIKSKINLIDNNTCPECNQKINTEETKRQKKKYAEQMGALKQTHQSLLEQKTLLKEQINEIDKEVAAIEEKHDINKTQSLLQKFKQLEVELNVLKNRANPFQGRIEGLKQTLSNKPDIDRYHELKHIFEHQKLLIVLLTKQNSFIRQALIRDSLNILNKQLNYYLEQMQLPFIAMFTPKLQFTLQRLGREYNFSMLSNGQRTRVNFALALAFRDVLQFRHSWFNIAMFDEILDMGLDKQGIEDAIYLLKTISKEQEITTYVISHNVELHGVFNEKLLIKMNDGFSEIEEIRSEH